MEQLARYVSGLAQQLGASDPSLVIIVVVLAFLFLVLILFALRTTVGRHTEDDRTTAILVRVAQLEKNLESFRKEMGQNLEQFRSLTQDVRRDMEKVRRGSGGGGGDDGGGSSAPPAGGGGNYSGGGGGLASKAGAEAVSGAMERGLEKSRSSFLGKLRGLFSKKQVVDDSSLDDLEELLISSDVGAKCARDLVETVRARIQGGSALGEGELRSLLHSEIVSALNDVPLNHRMYSPAGAPMVVLVVGVNGVGKTTSVAKLAARYKAEGRSVVMVAADTFRAAAVQQLSEWGKRLNIPVISGVENAKPATVVFDGMVAAQELKADVVLIDTAGRLHTKSNLMQELEGVRNSVRRHAPDAPHETVLVLDGVSGQNALMQAREFHEAVSLTGVIITKLDGTPKGGIVIAISRELNLPVYYVGVGERSEDLIPFSREGFVRSLLSADSEKEGFAVPPGASGTPRQIFMSSSEPKGTGVSYIM